VGVMDGVIDVGTDGGCYGVAHRYIPLAVLQLGVFLHLMMFVRKMKTKSDFNEKYVKMILNR
ncbi:MAG: hypothetical protein ACRC9N_00175, partial [Aeromonas sp.]